MPEDTKGSSIPNATFRAVVSSKKTVSTGGYRITLDVFGEDVDAYKALHDDMFTRIVYVTIMPAKEDR